MSEAIVRRAAREDLPAVARLAAKLVRMHHAFDPRRFFVQEPVERGYEWWLGRELERESALVLVATLDEVVVGYAYATIEKRDWNLLLDDHGALHDVLVDEAARRRGVARALVRKTIEELTAMGAPRVVLMTATQNESARRLFEELGFRATMIEMTRES